MTNLRGFTLIELMIVLAIIGILAAVALPAYQDFARRSLVAEGLVLASGAKTAVWGYYTQKGGWPADNAAAGLALPASIQSDAVDSVTVAGSKIELVFNQAVQAGKTVVLEAQSSAGGLSWSCDGGDLIDRYRPLTCR